MRKWWVVTPEFPYTEIISWEIGGPTYDVCDAIEIEAETKHDALRLGVKAMLDDHRSYEYCKDQRDADMCPYTGVTVEEV